MGEPPRQSGGKGVGQRKARGGKAEQAPPSAPSRCPSVSLFLQPSASPHKPSPPKAQLPGHSAQASSPCCLPSSATCPTSYPDHQPSPCWAPAHRWGRWHHGNDMPPFNSNRGVAWEVSGGKGRERHTVGTHSVVYAGVCGSAWRPFGCYND